MAKKERFKEPLKKLEKDFKRHPEAVLSLNGLSMVRGIANKDEPLFIVSREPEDIAPALKRHAVTIIPLVGAGKGEVYELAGENGLQFKDFDLYGLGSGRRIFDYVPRFIPAKNCAKLLVPAALEADPLPINQQNAQILIDTFAN